MFLTFYFVRFEFYLLQKTIGSARKRYKKIVEKFLNFVNIELRVGTLSCKFNIPNVKLN